MGGDAHGCTTPIEHWDAATACSHTGMFYATVHDNSCQQTLTNVYRQLHTHSNPEKQPPKKVNYLDAIFLLFPPCLCCYSTCCYHFTTLSAASASLQPIKVHCPPNPASIAQIRLAKLRANLLNFFYFYFSSSGACQKKNQCGKNTNVNNIELCRSNI